MKISLLVLSVFFVGISFSQSNDLYGISRNSNPNVTHLATVNAVNGIINDISETSYAEGVANFSFTVDPILGVYYFSDIDTFIGLDMNTGELVSQNAIVTTEESIFQNFMYNEMTQEIIGIERGGYDSGVYLSKIDPTTGIVTPISQVPFADTNTITVAGAAIDLQNQWYHIFSEGRILSVDIETGVVVHSPFVDTTEYEFFNNLIYNAADRKLYAIGRNNAPAELFFIQIDPITGVVTTISPESIGESLALEGSALDPYTGIYYFKRPNNPTSLVSIDINTGIELNAIPFDFNQSNGAFFGHFFFGGETAQLLSTTDFSNNAGVTLYPNPTSTSVQIAGKGIRRVQAFSTTGQQLLDKNYFNQQDVQLDMSSYSNGIYFLKILESGEKLTTLKLIKN